MKPIRIVCALLCAQLIAANVWAADEGTTYLVPPVPVNVQSPIFPRDAPGNEAWVQLSFTVKADGTTTDFAVTDGFYSDTFRTVTLSAAKNWKFTPGTENGKPIDWSNYTFNIPFTHVDIEGGAYPAFSSRYEKIAGLLREKNFAEAKVQVQDAFNKGAVRLLYEYAVAESLLYSAETGLGRRQAAYKAIRSATPVIRIERRKQSAELGSRISNRVQLSSSALLPDDTLAIALRNRFTSEANLGFYLDALATYERIGKIEKIADTDILVGQVKTIREMLTGSEPLMIAGRIEDGAWFSRPSRREFTVANVKGTIERIRINCNRHAAVVAFKGDLDWSLPESWGDCDLTLEGSEGTEFVFVQAGAPITSRYEPQTPLTVTPVDELVTMPTPPLPPPSGTPF